MKRLVVYVPGIGVLCQSWKPFLDQLTRDAGWGEETALLPHDHGATILSSKRAVSLAADLAADIDTWWNVHGPVDDVILLGHSMGALLVRHAYLTGLGHRTGVSRPWARHVRRIVLFSGINRGIELKRQQRLFLPVLLPGKRLLKDLLSGSDFVTNLRIWWMRRLATVEKRPVVIQVRGGSDTLIRKEDSIDVEGFLEGHEVFVPGANHKSLLLPDQQGGFSNEKFTRLRFAVTGDFPDEASPDSRSNPDNKIVFVVHGIRDSNDAWVTSMSRAIADRIPGAEVVPPTFGRFSALEFVLPVIRRSKVRWFQDLYSMKLSKNPLAKFYFVGHSYGTFLVGHGLKNLPGMEFERVLLAGSVLPEAWEWAKFGNQVKEVRNCRAQHDKPVAILCRALRGVGLGDGIGSAGYTGFYVPFGPNSEQFFYAGGHDATVSSEQAQTDIVEFVEKGNVYTPPGPMAAEDTKFTRYSAASPVLGYVLILICLLVSAACTLLFGQHTLVSFATITAEVLLVFILGLFTFLAFY